MSTSKQNYSEISYIQQINEFDYLLNLIKSFENGKSIGILLFGPPGTGKTLLAESLAKNFKAPYYIIDGSPDLDRRDIEGNWELVEGKTIFNYGPLTLAIKSANEHGIAFIIINEINAIRESEQISLNSLLAESNINLISKGFEQHRLNENSKLVIVGTMNKGVLGVNKLQEAFDDRFVANFEINYPEKDKEIEIATKITGCKPKIVEMVVDTARQIRKQAVQDYSLTKIFSTRLIVNFCNLISKTSPEFLKNNIENAILNKLGESPEEKKSITMILDGKMFENNLKKLLTKEEEMPQKPTEPIAPIDIDQCVVTEMKSALAYYIGLYGVNATTRRNGEIMWKPLLWLWRFYREAIQNYFKLTEMIQMHAFYERDTKKSYLYNGKVTLRFIKWMYMKRSNDLLIFMSQIRPVL